HDGRGGVEARDRRERRLRARLAPLPLERLEQRRLLAADVSTRAAVHHDRDVSADVTPVAQLLQRADEDLVRAGVLAADVDEHARAVDRVRRDQAALDEAVWDSGNDLVVLEAARLGLVGVHDEIVRLRDLLLRRDERPLAARWEERAAASAELGGD